MRLFITFPSVLGVIAQLGRRQKKLPFGKFFNDGRNFVNEQASFQLSKANVTKRVTAASWQAFSEPYEPEARERMTYYFVFLGL